MSPTWAPTLGLGHVLVKAGEGYDVNEKHLCVCVLPDVASCVWVVSCTWAKKKRKPQGGVMDSAEAGRRRQLDSTC